MAENKTDGKYQNLFHVLVQQTSTFVCTIDALAMKFTCKGWYSIKLHFQRVVQRYLLELFPSNRDGRPDGKEFIDKLQKHGAVLSGGFILRCLYGMPVNWDEKKEEKGDIDLYVPGCTGNVPWQWEYSFLRDWNPAHQDCVKEFPRLENQSFRSRNYGGQSTEHADSNIVDDVVPVSIIHLRKYEYSEKKSDEEKECDNEKESNKVKLDYIIVNPRFRGGIPAFIDKAFDVSVCKVWFDGKILWIKNLEEHFNRTFTSETTANVFALMESYIVDEDELKIMRDKKLSEDERLLKRLQERSDKRVIKYESRGFRCLKNSVSLETYKKHDWFLTPAEESSAEEPSVPAHDLGWF